MARRKPPAKPRRSADSRRTQPAPAPPRPRAKASPKTGTKAASRAGTPASPTAPPPLTLDQALDIIELHRHGFALAVPPAPGSAPLPSRRVPIAVLLQPPADSADPDARPMASCTCAGWSRRTGRCAHVDTLLATHRVLCERAGGDVHAHFQQSMWLRLLAPMAEEDEAPLRQTVVTRTDGAPGEDVTAPAVLRMTGADGRERAAYLSDGPDAVRLAERLGARLDAPDARTPAAGPPVPRAAILEQLAVLTQSEYEARMRQLGHRTQGQILEDSLWHRLAYHAYRELDGAQGRQDRQVRAWLVPSVDPATNALTVTAHAAGRGPVLRVHVPPRAAPRVLAVLRELPVQDGVPVHPARLRPLLRVIPRPDGGARVEPVVRLPAPAPGHGNAPGAGELVAIDPRHRQAEAAFLPARGILAELEEPGPVAAALGIYAPRDLGPDDMPALLAAVAEARRAGDPADLDDDQDNDGDEVIGLTLLRGFERIEIDARALGRDWCWLSLRYGRGNGSVSLAALLAARRRGQRFVDTAAGWVDLEDDSLACLGRLDGNPEASQNDDQNGDLNDNQASDQPNGSDLVRLSRLELLRLLHTGDALAVACTGQQAPAMEQLLAIQPVRPLAPLAGLRSTLRDYQVHGVTWLLYLYDNGLGGLLCDDMGLGKTHQVMAFLVALREQRQVTGPFLVVCPTTVLSHWQRVLAAFAPGLVATVFHGGGRDLDAALAGTDVLLTSYGILRNDIDDLCRVPFAAAVLDEAQYLKNPATRAYRAAMRLEAGMRLGLSGTPIENTLMDLKALLDLALPGYLDTDDRFRARFVQPVEERGHDHDSERARAALRRLIAPFVLRRTKATVLDQLPPVIEDLRTCTLSDEQIKLYRDAVDGRGQEIMAALRDPTQTVPYVHVFALLTLLKQICCHPALVTGAPDQHQDHASGKWELFQELLDECLGSGQKIVVYSQFLGMVRIIEQHLRARGVGVATLTGQTRDRGAVIERFARDPDCRVFVATLQAGGVGIDLVAASVVIHYDRWWNAAREDQATDRVHRMGQTRGVHVLKLITEGTLEEKIAALIDKKRQLMESVVTEDEAGTIKALTREELMGLLSLGGVGEPAS